MSHQIYVSQTFVPASSVDTKGLSVFDSRDLRDHGRLFAWLPLGESVHLLEDIVMPGPELGQWWPIPAGCDIRLIRRGSPEMAATIEVWPLRK